MTLVVSFFRS